MGVGGLVAPENLGTWSASLPAKSGFASAVKTRSLAAKLAHDFPDRQFEVIFPDEESEDLLDYEVSFYQA